MRGLLEILAREMQRRLLPRGLARLAFAGFPRLLADAVAAIAPPAAPTAPAPFSLAVLAARLSVVTLAWLVSA
jgi:hypothetical protein